MSPLLRVRLVAAVAAVALLALAPAGVHAFAKGAPEDSCEDMVPQHGVPPQNGASPYALTAAKGTSGVALTLKGSKPFKGFLVIARDDKGQAVGTFKSSPGARTVNCSGKAASGATHTSPDDKDGVTLNWTPNGFKGKVTFYFTTALNGGEFWVAQKSAPVSL